MKKLLRSLTAAAAAALICIQAGLCTFFSPAPASAVVFSDIPYGYWAASMIEQATTRGYLQGDGTGRFLPDRKVTGAEFAAMLVRAWYPEEIAGISADGAWYTPVMDSAMSHGLFHGTSFDGFDASPSDFVTRLDMAWMVMNCLLEKGINKPWPDVLERTAEQIPDIDSLSPEDRETAAMAYSLGLLTGTDSTGSFHGELTLTRAQAAAVLMRMEGFKFLGSSFQSTDAPSPEITADADMLFGLRPGENVQTMMNRINAATPPWREGYLACGLPASSENIKAVILEAESRMPDGFHWDANRFYNYDSFFFGVFLCGGCASFAAGFSDAIFGEDAPIDRHQNFEQIRPGDVLLRMDMPLRFPSHNGHALVCIEAPDEDGNILCVSGNYGKSVAWYTWESVSDLYSNWAENSYVYTRW